MLSVGEGVGVGVGCGCGAVGSFIGSVCCEWLVAGEAWWCLTGAGNSRWLAVPWVKNNLIVCWGVS